MTDSGRAKSLDARVRPQGITRRSVLLGFVLAVCHTVWVVYEEQALGHLPFAFTSLVLLPSALGIVFFLLIVNSALKRWRPGWMLAPAELMVVFIMVTVSAVIAGADLLQLLFPVLVSPRIPSASTMGWDKYFHYIPRWFVPQEQSVHDAYYLGTHRFWGFFSPEIFRPWILPMLFWGTLLFTIAWTTLCFSSILRRQWLDREKLSFPIIELPLMMVRENTIGSVFRNRLLVAGFTVTSAVMSLNYLSSLYPSIPGVQLHIVNIGKLTFTNPPFSGMNPIFISWWPIAIGLCYLIPLDVSFSSWFFYVLIRLVSAFGTAQGWRDPAGGFPPNQFPFIQHLAEGAWIGIFFTVMWSARGHLKQVVRTAFGKERIPDEDREPMSYRFALFGALAGFCVLILMAVVSGLRLQIALLFLAVYLLALVVMCRIYAQIAVPIFELYFFSAVSLTTHLSGITAMTRQDATILSQFHWLDRCYRQHFMGHEFESMAFADKLGQRARPIPKILAVALVTGIILGMLTILQIRYDRGTAAGAEAIVRVEVWGRLTGWMSNPTHIEAATLAKIGTSAAIVFLLAAARTVWFGFPLHPIGYGFATGYAMEYIWNTVFATWLIKVLVLRYGGLRLYRKSLPLFFGIILGDAVTQLTWSIILGLMGAKGGTPYGPVLW